MLPLKRGFWGIFFCWPHSLSWIAYLKPPQSCCGWSMCPQCSLLSFVPLTLPVYFMCIYIWLLSRDCEILTASTACGYQAWNLPCGCTARYQGKESVGIRGATLQAGCQTPCAAPALVLFLCPFSLQPSQDRGGMGRAFPRIVMAEFCQECRNFVLMQPRHHSKPNTQTSGNWRNVRFSQQS